MIIAVDALPLRQHFLVKRQRTVKGAPALELTGLKVEKLQRIGLVMCVVAENIL